jgi:hypothetical protein
MIDTFFPILSILLHLFYSCIRIRYTGFRHTEKLINWPCSVQFQKEFLRNNGSAMMGAQKEKSDVVYSGKFPFPVPQEICGPDWEKSAKFCNISFHFVHFCTAEKSSLHNFWKTRPKPTRFRK